MTHSASLLPVVVTAEVAGDVAFISDGRVTEGICGHDAESGDAAVIKGGAAGFNITGDDNPAVKSVTVVLIVR